MNLQLIITNFLWFISYLNSKHNEYLIKTIIIDMTMFSHIIYLFFYTYHIKLQYYVSTISISIYLHFISLYFMKIIVILF